MERNIVRLNAGSKAFDSNIEEIRQAKQTNKTLSNIQQEFIKKFSVGEIISADELQELQDVLRKFKELSAVSTDARIHFIEMVGEISNTVAIIARDLQDSNHFDIYTKDLSECINIVKRLGESQLEFHSNTNETSNQLQKLLLLFDKLQQNAANDISLDSTSADNIFDKKEELKDSFSKIKDTAEKAELTNNALQEFHNILQNTLKDNNLLVGKLNNDIQNTNKTINQSTTDLLNASKAFKTDIIPGSFDMLHSGLQDIQIASNKINEQLITTGTIDKNIFKQFNEGINQAKNGQAEVQITINNALEDLNRPFLEHIVSSSMNALNAISQAEKVYKDAIELSDKLNNDLHYDAIQMLRDSKQQMEVAKDEVLNTMRTQAAENIEFFFNAVAEFVKNGKSDLYTESATGYNLGTNYINAANLAGNATVDVYQKSIQLQSIAGIANRRRLQKIQEKAQRLASIQQIIAKSETNAMRSIDALNKAKSPEEKKKLKNQAQLQFSKAMENQMLANVISQELGNYIDEMVVNGLNDFGKDGKAIVTSIENILNQNQTATRNLLSAASNYHLEINENNLSNLKEQYKALGKRAVTLHETNLKYTDFSKYFSTSRISPIRNFKNVMRSITNGLSNLGIQGFSLNIFDYIFKPLKYISEQGKERYKTMGIDAAVGVMDMNTSAAQTQQRLMEGNQLYASSGGMIDRGFINNMYKDLMKNVGGHYGNSPEQAREDVNKFVHQTYKIAVANGIDNSTMQEIFQTYYKDMKLSSEEAAGEFAKMMNTAKNANVPIKKYMDMMNNLAKTFMNVGIKGTKADEVMQKLLMDGLRADIAVEVTQQAAGALSQNSQDRNWIAYAASVSGMNPFEGIARAAYSHEADGSERAGWADDMVKLADIRIKTMAGAAGNDPNIKRMIVTDEFKKMGFSQRSSSILTSSYMSGNTEQFKRLFSEESAAKDNPRAKLDKANEEAEKALNAMAGQLAELDKINASLDAAMYYHASKLTDVVNDLIRQISPIIKKLTEAMMILATTIVNVIKTFIQSETLQKIGNFVFENPLKSIAGIISGLILSRVVQNKFGNKGKWGIRIAKFIGAGFLLDDVLADNKKTSPSSLDILVKGLDEAQAKFTGESLNKPIKDEKGNIKKDKDGKVIKEQSDPLVNIISSMGQTLKGIMGLRKGKTVQEAIEDTPSMGISDISVNSSNTNSVINSLRSTSSSSSESISSNVSESSISTGSITKTESSSGKVGDSITITDVSEISSSSKFNVNQPTLQNIATQDKKPIPASLKSDEQITTEQETISIEKKDKKKEKNKKLKEISADSITKAGSFSGKVNDFITIVNVLGISSKLNVNQSILQDITTQDRKSILNSLKSDEQITIEQETTSIEKKAKKDKKNKKDKKKEKNKKLKEISINSITKTESSSRKVSDFITIVNVSETSSSSKLNVNQSILQNIATQDKKSIPNLLKSNEQIMAEQEATSIDKKEKKDKKDKKKSKEIFTGFITKIKNPNEKVSDFITITDISGTRPSFKLNVNQSTLQNIATQDKKSIPNLLKSNKQITTKQETTSIDKKKEKNKKSKEISTSPIMKIEVTEGKVSDFITIVNVSGTSSDSKLNVNQPTLQNIATQDKKLIPNLLKFNEQITTERKTTSIKKKDKKEEKNKKLKEISKNKFKESSTLSLNKPLTQNIPLIAMNIEGKPIDMKDTTLERDYQEIEMRKLGQLGMDKSAILSNMRSNNNITTEEILAQYNYPINKSIPGQPSQEKLVTPFADVASVDKYNSLSDYYNSFFSENISKDKNTKKESIPTNIFTDFNKDINNVQKNTLNKVQDIAMVKGHAEMKQFEKDEQEKFSKQQAESKSDTSRKNAMNSHAKKVITQAKKNEDLSKVRNKNITEFMKLMQQLWGNFQASTSIEHSNLWKKLNETEEVLKIINENWITYGKALGTVNFGGFGGSESGTGNTAWNKKVLYMKFKAAGYSDEAIAGILGRVQQEHNFNTSNVEEHWANGLWVGGYGMFQWNGGRTKAFLNWCKENGLNPQDPGVQADYAIKEAKERGLGPDYMNKLSVSQAADVWTRKWEVGVSGSEQAYAAKIYQEIKSGAIMNAQATNPAINRSGVSRNFGNAGSPSGTLNGLPLYRMWDSRWGNKPYEYASGGSNTMTMSGCGPTAFAMLASYHGHNMDPYQAAQIMKHMHTSEGTSHAGWESLAQQYGFKLRKTSSRQDVINALRQGKKILAAHGRGMFAGGGHYIIYAGMNQDGKVLVADPNQEGKRNNRGDNYGYDIDELLNDGGVEDWWIDETSGSANYSSSNFSGSRNIYQGNYLSANNINTTYQDKQQYMINTNKIGTQQISTAEKLQEEAEEKTQKIANTQISEIKSLSKDEQIKKLYTMKGPNNKTYSKNDVDYLLNKGYSAENIIRELSQSDTYKIKPKKVDSPVKSNAMELYRLEDAADITTYNNQVIVHSLNEQSYGVNTDTLLADNEEVVLADGRRVTGAYINNILRRTTTIGDPFLEEFLRNQNKIDNEEIIEEGMNYYYRKVQLRINIKNAKELFLNSTGNKIEKNLTDLQNKFENISEDYISFESFDIKNKFKQIQGIVKRMKKE